WKACGVLIAALFMILPLNSARVAAINAPSATCYVSFFLAWYLIHKKRKLSALLFLFSFNINSLLVFYALPIIDLVIENARPSFRSIIRSVKSNWVFILLPFIYFFSKYIFFTPYGFYENYNNNFNYSNVL